jgi:hypothetical protein
MSGRCLLSEAFATAVLGLKHLRGFDVKGR